MIRTIEVKTLEGLEYSIEYEINNGAWVVLEISPIVENELQPPITNAHSDYYECEQYVEEDFMANIDDLVKSLTEEAEEAKGD